MRIGIIGAVVTALATTAVAETIHPGDRGYLIPAPGIGAVTIMVTSVHETVGCQMLAHLVYDTGNIAGMDAGHFCLGNIVAEASDTLAGLVAGQVYAHEAGTGLIIIHQ